MSFDLLSIKLKISIIKYYFYYWVDIDENYTLTQTFLVVVINFFEKNYFVKEI